MSHDGIIASSFAKQLSHLEAQVRLQWSWPSPEAGFSLQASEVVKEPLLASIDIASLGVESDSFQYAQSLATAGYLISLDSARGKDVQADAWAAGLDRLTERDAFPLDRQSFAFRPFELLGIVLGASSCERTSQKAIKWLKAVISRLEKEGNTDEWSSGLYGVAAHTLGMSWGRSFPMDLKSMPSQTLVCFVYDPEGICHNPVALENDLAVNTDEFRVIAIVSPRGL